jgi:hypothetical protein
MSPLPCRRKCCCERNHRLAHGISPRFGADAGSKDEIADRRHLFLGCERSLLFVHTPTLSATADTFRGSGVTAHGDAMTCV